MLNLLEKERSVKRQTNEPETSSSGNIYANGLPTPLALYRLARCVSQCHERAGSQSSSMYGF
jgi:hypothetical protein